MRTADATRVLCALAGPSGKEVEDHDKVQAIMAELASGLHTKQGALHNLAVLDELDETEAAGALAEDVRELVEAAKAHAEGDAGDSNKYMKAAETVKKRWQLFLTVYNYADSNQPTVKMVEEFTCFLFTTRQRRSLQGRQGLGDGAELMSRYALAQIVFAQLGYAGWSGLGRAEMKAKAQPFAEAIKEQWTRLRRAMPEMQSSAKPFVKEKWDETAVFLVQDEQYRNHANELRFTGFRSLLRLCMLASND